MRTEWKFGNGILILHDIIEPTLRNNGQSCHDDELLRVAKQPANLPLPIHNHHHVDKAMSLNSTPETKSTKMDTKFAPLTQDKSTHEEIVVTKTFVGNKSLENNVGTPRWTQRRKKHRPKVTTEAKPRTTKPPVTPTMTRENPAGKRKHIGKNNPRKRSCSRGLKFDETDSEDEYSVGTFPMVNSGLGHPYCTRSKVSSKETTVELYRGIKDKCLRRKVTTTATKDGSRVTEAFGQTGLRYNRNGINIVLDVTQGFARASKNSFPTTQPPESGIDALIAQTRATLTRKKRTKKRKRNPALVRYSEFRQPDNRAIRRVATPTNAIVPFRQEHNTLALYKGSSTEVPFTPFKIPRSRPRVDLDEETDRVWKLLLKSIDSEGIDGTDEEKAKRWEQEREVFRLRVDSFIARMHLLQGDRRFSKWKGSVLDSVVGVFLTQNASDHQSSSAFMSLASRYPLKPKERVKAGKVVLDESQVRNENEGITSSDKKLRDDFIKPRAMENDSHYRPGEGEHADKPPIQVITYSRRKNRAKEMKEEKECGPSSRKVVVIAATSSKPKRRKIRKKTKKESVDRGWDRLRKEAEAKNDTTENKEESLDWEAIRRASVDEVSCTIRERGMNNKLSQRIKDVLDRLVKDHGDTDLEWLRGVPPDQVKEYLLSFTGLGLKSVECVRLLTLHHLAFPVDTHVGRVAVRLGWVPLQPLPESLQMHLLELYPVWESIQKYLWPRLCKLDQKTLYELHYQMITFGKVFCTKIKPNCNECPMREECKHFASAYTSARLALPGPEDIRKEATNPNSIINERILEQLIEAQHFEAIFGPSSCCEPIIEEPVTPEPQCILGDIEDFPQEDPEEIPTIKLNAKEFAQNLLKYMEKNNMEHQDHGDMSTALVALSPEAASIPMAKLKNMSRLRTEHQVYELPDDHPILEMLNMDKRESDDPIPYLLAIWAPGETPNSTTPAKERCSSSHELTKLCDDGVCFSCNTVRETNSQTVRGTLLIPCRTAMRGRFPLNGTYFQVNEVFADHDSSLRPIDVPRDRIWKLKRSTVYFGTSIPAIFRGMTTQAIQHCFWKGYVCVRGFDQKCGAPRPLMARLHFPANKGKRIPRF